MIRVTGVITMRIGKVAACAIGGSIIVMQIAAQEGYIKINWDKILRKAEKITDKVEEKITGEGPNLMDKVCIKSGFLLYFTLNKTKERFELKLKILFLNGRIILSGQVIVSTEGNYLESYKFSYILI